MAKKTQAKKQTKKQEYLLIATKYGDIKIKFFEDVAPTHVARIKELVKSGFYDGIKFHRVIEDFMAQTGCPLGTGTGGSGIKLKAEFSKLAHKRGTVSQARAMDVNSGDSQFFICLEDCSWLDGQYTIWGEVEEGMDFVDMITKGDGANGAVSKPDIIIKATIS